MVWDEKDKIIIALAVGLLLVTTFGTVGAMVTFQRYGVRPVVHLTDFRVDYGDYCDGRIAFSFALTNEGRNGFAQVQVFRDDELVYVNNYLLARGETRPITELVFLGDCLVHSYAAAVSTTWT